MSRHQSTDSQKNQEETCPQGLDDSRLKTLLAVCPAVIYSCRADGDKRATFVSENIREQLGYETAECLNRPDFWAGRVHPEDRSRVFENQNELLRTGKLTHEYRFKHKDGTYRWMLDELRLLRDASGKPMEIVGSWMDISDRKEAEEKRCLSEKQLQSVFRVAPTGIGVVRNRILTEVNRRICDMTGYAPEELIGQSSRVLYPSREEYDRVGDAKYNQIAATGTGEVETRWLRKDGSIINVLLASAPLDPSDLSLGVSFTALDITDRKRAEGALEKRIVALTRPLDDTSNITFEELFNPKDIQRLQDDFANATGVASIITEPDGTPITVPSNFRRLCRDIVRKTEKGHANCYRSNASTVKPAVPGPSIQRCHGSGLLDAGAAIYVEGRHLANWLVGQVRDDNLTEDGIRSYARKIGADEHAMVEAFREIPVMSGEQFGQVAQALFSLANQLSVSAYQNVQQARFITEQKRAQEKIAFLAHHDQLTGLANRTLLAERFEQAAGHAQRTGTKMAGCVLDLDGFKAINDSHGHLMGDQLLCEVARRLKNAIRSSDTVCRIGGDEFVILFTDIQETDALTALIQKIRTCFEPCINLEGTFHSISASMGVAIYPEDGDEFSVLFEHADAAMYFAKDSGRNNVQFFRREINEQIQHRLTIEKELRQAFLDHDLELHYQPIFRLPEKHIVGVEALLRWRHPTKGYIPPDQFIPIAEESHLITSLGRWVLKAACKDMAAWRNMPLPALPVSINVSARQLFEKDFADFVAKTLTEYDLPPQQLELEVTESIFLESSDAVEAVMKELKSIGVGLSLDDFGTGYSSLSYLKKYQIDRLKIDRSFMDQVCSSQQDAVLVTTIIRMAQNLGMQVVSEGVETAGQVAFLIRQGCDLAQGFFFSKPLSFTALQEFLSRPLPAWPHLPESG